MCIGRKLKVGGRVAARILAALVVVVIALHGSAQGQVGPQDVLILVNENSPTSRYIANMYRRYYPAIADSQVLYLTGLNDSSGLSSTPADEVITRAEYDQYIAGPVRQYLTDADYRGRSRITQVKVIITTAGMPYRIADTYFGDAVYPAGSNYNTVVDQEASIDAASVESELTCLWHCDYDSNSFGRTNRLVNPYQGYRSNITLFARQLPGTKDMLWRNAISALAPFVENPRMEGYLPPPEPPTPPDWKGKTYYGTIDRQFHVGDMYLTARLDGPKNQGSSAVFAVRAVLERARRASAASSGVNPSQAVVVLDDAPNAGDDFDRNRTFNLTYGVEFWEYNDVVPQPPDADQIRVRDDYVNSYIQMTGSDPDSTLNAGDMNLPAGSLCVMLDRRTGTRTSQQDLDDYAQQEQIPLQLALAGLATFGKNGDEGSQSDYLYTEGPNGGPLFKVLNGAVFTSLESFNAVTMFCDTATQPVAQGKLVDFLAIGGTAAIGHSFEPQPDAAIDNEFLFYNLLADADGDGRADLSFVEAAFTAIPYLSWSEVVVGDPLMRIAYGPGEMAWWPVLGDVNLDGVANVKDVRLLKAALGGQLNSPDPAVFAMYNDLCDFNQDGRVNIKDVRIFKSYLQVRGRM